MDREDVKKSEKRHCEREGHHDFFHKTPQGIKKDNMGLSCVLFHGQQEIFILWRKRTVS
jgi:hypothetical protein